MHAEATDKRQSTTHAIASCMPNKITMVEQLTRRGKEQERKTQALVGEAGGRKAHCKVRRKHDTTQKIETARICPCYAQSATGFTCSSTSLAETVVAEMTNTLSPYASQCACKPCSQSTCKNSVMTTHQLLLSILSAIPQPPSGVSAPKSNLGRTCCSCCYAVDCFIAVPGICIH